MRNSNHYCGKRHESFKFNFRSALSNLDLYYTKMCRCWTIVKQKFSINVALLRGIVLCASIFGLIFYVDECYIKYKIKPEVLVNEKLVNSRTVPFPAVTICVPVIAKSEILNFTKLNEQVKQKKMLNRSELTSCSLLITSAQIIIMSYQQWL